MHALSNFVWIRGIKKARRYALGFYLVGMARFELTTPCTPCKCATGLRYIPIFWRWLPNKIPVNDRMGTGHLLRDGKNTPYFSILFPSYNYFHFHAAVSPTPNPKVDNSNTSETLVNTAF
jgi:hypothetical protein